MADIERTRLVRGLPVTEDVFYEERFDELFMMDDGSDLYEGVDIYGEDTDEMASAIIGVFPTVTTEGSIELELLDTYEDPNAESDPDSQYAYLRRTVDIANALGGFTNNPWAEVPLPEITRPEQVNIAESMNWLAFENSPTGGLVFYGEPELNGRIDFYHRVGFPREEALSQVLGMAAARLIGHGMDNGGSEEI